MWERCKACLPYTFPRWEDRPCSFLRLLPPLYVRLNPFLLLLLFFFPPLPFLSPATRSLLSLLLYSAVYERMSVCVCVWENLCVRSLSKWERKSKLQLYVAPIFSSFLIPRSFILRQHVVWKKLLWLLAININEFLILEGRMASTFPRVSSGCAFIVRITRSNVIGVSWLLVLWF